MVKNAIEFATTLLAAASLCDSVVARNESAAVAESSACYSCGNPSAWKNIHGMCAHWMPKARLYNVFFVQKGGDFKQCNCCRSFSGGPYGAFGDDWGHHSIDDEVECYFRKDSSSRQHINAWYWNTGLDCKAENKDWRSKHGK